MGNEDIDALLAWWRAQPLDVSFLPTPVAEYAFSQRLDHPTLRTLLIGGDRLRQFTQCSRRFAVINNYGPTEATVVATSGAVDAGQALHIGRPWPMPPFTCSMTSSARCRSASPASCMSAVPAWRGVI